MNKVRWGLLSTANINRHLIPAIRASRRGELAAVASRNVGSAKAYAAQWEIPHAYGSYDDLLASGGIDAVYISLPNHLHTEWSIRAMEAGVHVLCEKPLALSVKEVDLLRETSQRTGRVVAEAFMYRHHPQTKLVGEWVRSGRLGEISLVRGVFNFNMEGDREGNIRLMPNYGGGALWDVGVYPLSFAQFVMGSAPQWVSGEQWVGNTGVDETFAGQLHYNGGRLAQISCAFRTPFYTSVEVIGTQGRLTLNRPFVNMDAARKMIFYPAVGEPEEIPVPEKMLYLGEVEDLHASVLDGAPSYLALAESRDHIRTVTGLYESARTQRMVVLEPDNGK
jgi:predicted dehydrogenase